MPRQRINKEILLDQAYDIVKCRGIFALSAKSLSQAASCSVQPIYSYFENMDELKDYVYQRAGKEYQKFLIETVALLREKYKGESAALFNGMAHILFADQLPHLFFLLFQQTLSTAISTMLPHISEGQVCVEWLVQRIGETFEEKERDMAQGFFLFIHGTACAVHSGLVKMDMSLLISFLKHQYLHVRSSVHVRTNPENSLQQKKNKLESSYSCFRGFSGLSGNIEDTY